MQYSLDFSFCIFKKYQRRNYRLFPTWLRSKKQRQFCYFSFFNENGEPTTGWYLRNSKVALKRFWTMNDTNKTLVFSPAVRGFHVYRDVWKPLGNEELECLFERHNLFDMFAIKTSRLEGWQILGDLPREISRPTKFLLDRGAKVTA